MGLLDCFWVDSGSRRRRPLISSRWPRDYKLKHPGWNFDANGNLLGTFILRESITLDNGGNGDQGFSCTTFMTRQATSSARQPER